MADESKDLEREKKIDSVMAAVQNTTNVIKIRSEQQKAYNNFKKESQNLTDVSDERFVELMESAQMDDDLHKYLVNGAVLTCTQVTTDPFSIPHTGQFYVDEIPDMNTHLYTTLNVAENPIEINGRAYATVNDTIKGFNIHPFTGNCRVPASGAEAERIMLWQEFGIVDGKQLSQAGVKGGVCQCLMNLNEQWDNMFFKDGDGCIDRIDTDPNGYPVAAKGITRTSVLFCKHGGLIVPVTSGQDPVTRKRTIGGYEFQYDWMKEIPGKDRYVTEDALRKVVEISTELQINPDDLMAVMAFESWLDPHLRIGSGACGLIQFTNIAIEQINIDNNTKYTKDSIEQMDMMEQLDVVYLYLKPHIGKMKDLEDLYVAVLASKKVGEEIVYSKDKEFKEYNNNSGLDINKDGSITKAEATQKVIQRRDDYFCYED
jgi:hypothetical protein